MEFVFFVILILCCRQWQRELLRINYYWFYPWCGILTSVAGWIPIFCCEDLQQVFSTLSRDAKLKNVNQTWKLKRHKNPKTRPVEITLTHSSISLKQKLIHYKNPAFCLWALHTDSPGSDHWLVSVVVDFTTLPWEHFRSDAFPDATHHDIWPRIESRLWLGPENQVGLGSVV